MFDTSLLGSTDGGIGVKVASKVVGGSALKIIIRYLYKTTFQGEKYILPSQYDI